MRLPKLLTAGCSCTWMSRGNVYDGLPRTAGARCCVHREGVGDTVPLARPPTFCTLHLHNVLFFLLQKSLIYIMMYKYIDFADANTM